MTSPAAICHPVPVSCGDDAAAMTQPLAVALHALSRVSLGPDDAVAVIGAGGIGSFILAGAARRASAGRVVSIDIDDERLATARALGAGETANATGVDLAELLLELTGGVGFDVVIEASGAPHAPAAAIAGARRGGRVLLVGLHGEPRPIDLTRMILREVDIFTTVAHVCDSDIPAALELLAGSDVAAVTAGPTIRARRAGRGRPAPARRAAGDRQDPRDPRRVRLSARRVVVDVADVAGLVEAGGAGVAPQHDDRLVARVLEPVVVVLRHEHDLAGPELDIGVADARDPVTGDEVLPLLRVRVAVDVVLRPRRELRDAEDRVLRADASRA